METLSRLMLMGLALQARNQQSQDLVLAIHKQAHFFWVALAIQQELTQALFSQQQLETSQVQ
jgi:hypothetical protein